MIERLGGHRRAQPDRCGDERPEPFPARLRSDDLFERRAIVLRANQGAAYFCEGFQRVADGALFVRDLCLAKPL